MTIPCVKQQLQENWHPSCTKFIIISRINSNQIYFDFNLKTNVFRTRLVIESEKLPIHSSLVGPTVKLQSNW